MYILPGALFLVIPAWVLKYKDAGTCNRKANRKGDKDVTTRGTFL